MPQNYFISFYFGWPRFTELPIWCEQFHDRCLSGSNSPFILYSYNERYLNNELIILKQKKWRYFFYMEPIRIGLYCLLYPQFPRLLRWGKGSTPTLIIRYSVYNQESFIFKTLGVVHPARGNKIRSIFFGQLPENLNCYEQIYQLFYTHQLLGIIKTHINLLQSSSLPFNQIHNIYTFLVKYLFQSNFVMKADVI